MLRLVIIAEEERFEHLRNEHDGPCSERSLTRPGRGRVRLIRLDFLEGVADLPEGEAQCVELSPKSQEGDTGKLPRVCNRRTENLPSAPSGEGELSWLRGYSVSHPYWAQESNQMPSMMQRLEVENTTEDELRQEIERSARQAVKAGLREMRETIDRFTKTAYLHKTWLTLREAARYADITTTTLREWRGNGLEEAEVGGRTYIEREELDAFIASHKE